ncbi:MAG: signal peptide peptidase SppA [Candidatus Zixiibacteriota bacterium]
MAKKRDIIIGVVIGVACLAVFGIFGLAFLGTVSGGDDLGYGSIGGSDVGLVEMWGVIDDDSGRQLIRQLDRWGKTSSIKAVVIQVNSPGGSVAASQEVFDAIKRLKDEKPVVVSMASVAASGGYYISCAASKIVANPGTLTGSIGVIFEFNTYKGLMEKVGVNLEVVKSGELKDVGNYSRSMTENEQKMLHSVVMDSYEQFVGVVVEGRGLPVDSVHGFANGSVFTGLQAYKMGLVDTLGGLHEAIKLAAKLADLDPDPGVVRPIRRERVTFWDLIGQFMGNMNAAVQRGLSGPQLMYLYQ